MWHSVLVNNGPYSALPLRSTHPLTTLSDTHATELHDQATDATLSGRLVVACVPVEYRAGGEAGQLLVGA